MNEVAAEEKKWGESGDMKTEKRSKASEFQRAQLVAQPAAETKSKNINTERDLQQLTGHCYCKNNSEQRKIPMLQSK